MSTPPVEPARPAPPSVRVGGPTGAAAGTNRTAAPPQSPGRGRRLRQPVDTSHVTVHFDRTALWRSGWVIIGLVALAALLRWVLADAGNVIFTLVFSFLLSIAMEPAVSRLAHRMRRGVAAAIVLFGAIVLIIAFFVVFGRLLADQLSHFAQSVPGLVTDALDWVSTRFNVTLDYEVILAKLGIGTSALTQLAQNLAGGVFGLLASVLSAAFAVLTTTFFTYYFSADAPRLRRWLAALFPPRQQEVFATAWELAIIKTGGYVSARLVLAAICGGTAAAFMAIVGMPYWLPLGIWTGIVAQFVPTIGTYIAIALPVAIGLMGGEPWKGLAVFIFALVYQQIENVTIEPRISARGVDVHPAFSFAAVMFGASLFGVAGAFVAVPVSALMLSLFDIYSHKYELLPELAQLAPGEPEPEDWDEPDGTGDPDDSGDPGGDGSARRRESEELAREVSRRQNRTVTTEDVARQVEPRPHG